MEDGTSKPYDWTPYLRDGTTVKPWSETAPWPAAGESVVFTYTPHAGMPARFQGLTVKIRYEIYDGIAVMMKKVFVENSAATAVQLTGLTLDSLRIETDQADRLLIDTDYHGGRGVHRRNDYNRTWTRTDHADYADFRIHYKNGPAFHVGNRAVRSGQRWETTFESFRSFLLLHSTDHYEAQRMEFKKMYRTIAPQLREDLLFFSIRSDTTSKVRREAQNAAAVGFEAIVQSFWSGFDIHITLPSYREARRVLYDEIREAGLRPGGYQLFLTGQLYHPVRSTCRPGAWGNTLGLASQGFQTFFGRTKEMVEAIDMQVLEIDGAYPLSGCVASDHAYMVGEPDSRHKQWVINNEQYRYFRSRDIFLNVSDWHFLNGINKTGIGYEEKAWSQPRQEQLLLDRMFIYNGTYEKSPPWTWSFLPIMEYKPGPHGSAAAYFPMAENTFDYNWALAQNFLSGVQHTFYGRGLYDTDAVKAIVKYWVDVYKTYRPTLKSDIVHIKPPKRNPDAWARGTGMDAFVHVAPGETERALLVVFNQTDQVRTESLPVPLYYTGLTNLSEPPMSAPGSYLSTPDDIPKFGDWSVHEAAGLVPDWDDETAYPEATPTGTMVDFHVEGGRVGEEPSRRLQRQRDHRG